MVKTVKELTQSIQVKEVLGSGGFAWVFKGVYQASDVAVKLAAAPKDTDRERFCREAVLAQQLRHPHVVTTYVARGAEMSSEMIEQCLELHTAGNGGGTGAGTSGGAGGSMAPNHPGVPDAFNMLPNFPSTRSEDNMGNPRVARQEAGGWGNALRSVGVLPDQILMVMVLELCDMGNLSATLKRGVFVPVPGRTSLLAARRMLVRTATEICRGMLHLHISNVIHGDLKPSNVLLSRARKDRRGFVAKVADFGLSKLLHDDTNLVMSDHIGTVAYSSPEAIQGNHSKACDVWSFGMLLWELVAQERPFSSFTPAQIMMGVGYNRLRPTWPREVWPELCAIGERCLATNPADRPSFAQLEEELVVLEEALRDESLRMSLQRAAAAAASTASTASTTSSCTDGPGPSIAATAATAVAAAPVWAAVPAATTTAAATAAPSAATAWTAVDARVAAAP
ncbi:hypothetical protein HXX76_015391 [Chlamydomonas incerta]|uniref:Protein kinase domain-containing protein n=1 Tax=Chlamydomonas incerta TaxID=51695 RepID=A0A835VRN9_CHLIN|nr:hypothetical protein HXX76_015391 [Chlamydomonas incerta]|eukprot:KAG2423343.1 hypothetical protein HXX76_015391 [Chlamydomonas incerta]